jgi:hypothetical protein
VGEIKNNTTSAGNQEGKRPVGRPWRGSENNISIDL